MCQEFCSQGGRGSTYAGTPWDQVPPRPGTPPPDQVPPRTRYTLQDQVHPLGAGTPPLGPGTPPEQCMLGDTGNKWAVRILLECILVFVYFWFVFWDIKLINLISMLLIFIFNLFQMCINLQHECILVYYSSVMRYRNEEETEDDVSEQTER